MRTPTLRLLAGPVALALGAGLAAVLPATPAAAQPGAVTVRIDPSYQHSAFEGWGTSLVWFANITGGYPDQIRTTLADMVFGADGLNLNWEADANQRWWVDQIKDTVDHWEAFSNSPPWFQTVSGYVSGGFDSSVDQIRSDRVDEFAAYLVGVVEQLEQAHGIEFDTVEPLNEANTPYWGTQLGPDGQPTGGRQEGAHAGPALQQQVILALAQQLATGQTGAMIAAMDETNPGTFLQNWYGYGTAGRAAVDQLNVHTYGTGQRTSVRDVAKGEDKPLWMSEVEGSFHSPTDYTSMEPGLGIATRIVDDLRELEPSAWVFWQPIEDTIPQQEGGGNWGSIHIPFNCPANTTLQNCPIQTNTKFHTIRNFTHYLRPGDRLVATDDPSSVAAIKPAGAIATVVHVNNGTQSRAVTLDLSGFATVSAQASVTPVVSSAGGGLVQGTPVPVSGQSATVVVPAKSVTTLLVDGVAGVDPDAAPIQPGHGYQLTGVQSGRSLAPATDGPGVVIRTTDAGDASQQWEVRKLTGGFGNRERYELVNLGDGRRLAVRDNAAVLEAGGPADPAAQWILSTTGDGTWTFVNAATGRLLDVVGQATADGSPVSTWTPNSGANQRWAVVS